MCGLFLLSRKDSDPPCSCHYLYPGVSARRGQTPAAQPWAHYKFCLSESGRPCLVRDLRGKWSQLFIIENDVSCGFVMEVKKSLSCIQFFVTLWTVAFQVPLSMGFSGKNTGVGCHFLLQGIFLTQGSNPGLWHCRQTLPSEPWGNFVCGGRFPLCPLSGDFFFFTVSECWDFPGGPMVKNPAAHAGNASLTPGSERFHMPWNN